MGPPAPTSPAADGPQGPGQTGEFPPAAEPSTAAESPSANAAAASDTAVTRPRERYGFHFHGNAEEFFRIWIVNTLLTLLTAGLFFPWAKVRKRRYLRGSTELMGHRFDYRADPRRLLIGHLLIAAFFLGYSVFGVVYPVVRWGVLVFGVALLPWVVVRSLSFNAHNTVYRGLRFRFRSSLSPAVSVFLLQPLLVVCTAGLYYPAWVRARRRLVVDGHRLGDAYFSFGGAVSPFYVAYLAGFGVMLGALFVGGLYLAAANLARGGVSPSLTVQLPFFLVYGLGWWTAKHLVHALLFNRVWNDTRLDDHRFEARMKTGHWVALQLVNVLAVIATLGALYPWAVVRAHKYTASCLTLIPVGPVDRIVRLEANQGSATGDTAAEFVGIDFGI